MGQVLEDGGPAEAAGRRLHCRTRGEGPVVVLLHGLGATSHIWDALELPGYRTLALDLPGCGASPEDDGATSPGESAALVDGFLDEVRAGPVAVLGHSMGGLVALELALRRPDRVRAAIVMNVPARLPRVAHLSAAPVLGEALFGLGALAPVSRRAVRLYLGLIFGDARKITEAHVDGYAAVTAAPGYYRSMLAGLRGLRGWDMGDRFQAFAVPTAILWGTRDRLLPLSLGQRLASSLPGASFHPIHGCGHSPPEEAPEAVAAIARAMLERRLPPRGASV